MAPESVVEDAVTDRAATISYTYTEPTIYFELALDTARLAEPKGLRNVFVTNGYMTEDCLRKIGSSLHGANVDLKSFSDTFYKEQCGARLEPILHSIKTMKDLGIWVEVTTLLIPGMNDSREELGDLAKFLADLDPNIPWHISRFHPTYRLTQVPPTSAESIHRAREIGYEMGLKYVYSGNLPGDEGEKTWCHECGELLIDRTGFMVRENRITNSLCPVCGVKVPGVWE
jgi:pyruvate formate lyase activating enzyme